jgi:hypothetical protein
MRKRISLVVQLNLFFMFVMIFNLNKESLCNKRGSIMKRVLILFVFSFIYFFSTYAQVGIGTINPDSTAKLHIESTDKGFLPPRVTKTERDAIPNPAEGLTIFNTDADCLQIWNSTYWYDACGNTPILASGGDNIFDVDINNIQYRVHVFETSGDFEVIYSGGAKAGEIEYLIIAGGGSGGIAGAQGGGGGGGAGGVIEGSTSVIEQVYTISVGEGGESVSGDHTPGNNGQNSTAFGNTAIGGGRGGSGNGSCCENDLGFADAGGSGGGAGTTSGNEYGSGEPGEDGQGNAGADANTPNGGGGGGAGANGGTSPDISTAANGGDGISLAITGTPTFYAGGGAGSGPTSGTNAINPPIGDGGSGGGGGNNAVDGVDGKGGGGAAGLTNAASGKGGDGVVIIRYPLYFP